jgi:hypothetical protein
MRLITALVLAFAVIASGCTDLLPPGATAFTPPPVYSTWWAMVESCSNQAGPLSRVNWFEAPDNVELKSPNGGVVGGYWDKETNTIVVQHRYLLDGPLIRHEMLHSLTGGGHERRYFLRSCGGIVVCVEACKAEAGGYELPGESVPRVPPDSLVITTTVEPLTLDGTISDSFFRVIVSVRNPANHPIVVNLPPSGDSGPSVTFSYVIKRKEAGFGGVQSDRRLADPEQTYFDAHETKRCVFDWVARPIRNADNELPPGTYTAVGGFGKRNAPPVSFMIP